MQQQWVVLYCSTCWLLQVLVISFCCYVTRNCYSWECRALYPELTERIQCTWDKCLHYTFCFILYCTVLTELKLEQWCICMYSQSWFQHSLEGICENWISCHKGKILTIAFRSSNLFQASVKTPGVKCSRCSLSVVNTHWGNTCVQVAKLHPHDRGDYFALPQNKTLKYFLVTYFHVGGSQNWNHKPKKIIQIFTIIHEIINKLIRLVSEEKNPTLKC